MTFYHLITTVIFFLSFPILILWKKDEILSRLGEKIPSLSNSIWFHAASVGEINALKPLILEVMKSNSTNPVIVSTMTKTGKQAAQKINSKIFSFLYPIDLWIFISPLFKKLKPKLIILMETELWPSMLDAAIKTKTPVIMVNARLSEKSFKNYKLTTFFWKPLWKSIVTIGAQTKKDQKLFEKLGFSNVVYTKNLKFNPNFPKFPQDTREKWFFNNDDLIVVLGSSRPGEELLLKSIISELNDYGIKIILCPRHLERIPEIITLFDDYTFYSRLKKPSQLIIIDVMGVLLEAYSIADIAIVGGSFFDFGGHNPLEPAFYEKAIIMGNFFSSCNESVQFLKENNAIVLSTEENFRKDILRLISDKDLRHQMGENAKKVVLDNSDSLKNNLNLIKTFLR